MHQGENFETPRGFKKVNCMTLHVHILGVKKRKLESKCGKWLEME